MRYYKASHCYSFMLALAFVAGTGAYASADFLTQVDTFDAGDDFGWGVANQSFTIEANGGPLGAGDGYFAYSSNGFSGPNSRMTIPNEVFGNQWSGDYAAAGVTGYELDVRNPGAEPLSLRVAIANLDTWYAATDPVVVPAGSDWVSVAFMISEDAMTQIGSGTDSFVDVASAVSRVRLLSSAALPTVSFGGTGGAQGEAIAASIDFDNFRAIGVPEPAALMVLVSALFSAFPSRR